MTLLTLLILMFLLAALVGCGGERGTSSPSDIRTEPPFPSVAPSEGAGLEQPFSARSGTVVISFDYRRQSGHASNQFAVWIEDTEGVYVKTLYATRFTAVGGYKDRPDSLSVWAERSGLAGMSDDRVDAITGATPQTGLLEYIWDLTGENSEPMPTGTYKCFVEGSLRWKNRVLYSGGIEIGDKPAVAEMTAEFVYEASDRQPALTADASENGMIGAVKAEYILSHEDNGM
jgi:hypothetical protein